MILITGATGSAGREAAKFLSAKGEPVKAVSRNPVAKLAVGSASLVLGNPAEPETLEADSTT